MSKLFDARSIVKKVLLHTDGAFLAKRRVQEAAYLEEIDKTFAQHELVRLPLLSEDPQGLAALSSFSSLLSSALGTKE